MTTGPARGEGDTRQARRRGSPVAAAMLWKCGTSLICYAVNRPMQVTESADGAEKRQERSEKELEVADQRVTLG